MSDACFPRLHVRPAKGWINDPNGVCRVDGRWHVFFQYNPHSPRHHRVGWGHWSSPDLVAWTEHEPALMPTPIMPWPAASHFAWAAAIRGNWTPAWA